MKASVSMGDRGHKWVGTRAAQLHTRHPGTAKALSKQRVKSTLLGARSYSMQDTQPSTSVPSSAIWRSRM